MSRTLYMETIGRNASSSLTFMSNLSLIKKNSVLKLFSSYLKNNSKLILKENKKDLKRALKFKKKI